MMKTQLSAPFLILLFSFLFLASPSYSFNPINLAKENLTEDELTAKKKSKFIENVINKYIQKKSNKKNKTLSIGQKALLLGIAALLVFLALLFWGSMIGFFIKLILWVLSISLGTSAIVVGTQKTKKNQELEEATPGTKERTKYVRNKIAKGIGSFLGLLALFLSLIYLLTIFIVLLLIIRILFQ